LDDGRFSGNVCLICSLRGTFCRECVRRGIAFCDSEGFELEWRFLHVEFIGLHSVKRGYPELRCQHAPSRSLVIKLDGVDIMAGHDFDGRILRLARWRKQPELRGASDGGIQFQFSITVLCAEHVAVFKQFVDDYPPVILWLNNLCSTALATENAAVTRF